VGIDAAFKPTSEQKSVIEADEHDRLLVDAGPGTGKTAVACARIAWLVNQKHLEPSQIWLISFTRTAVHELRYRIAAFIGDAGEAAAIRIATIDSHAWAIQSGFTQDAALKGSFDDNIRRVIELVRSHEGVFEYLSSVRHLVVDEAQDVVGPRCELLMEIIAAVPESCGVSVFSDEAQAIYGLAEDGAHQEVDGTLPDMIRENLKFDEMELTEVRRTNDRILKAVFKGGREALRNPRTKGQTKLARVRELVEEANHGTFSNHREDLKNLPAELSNAFLLFRKRGEALEASGYLGCRPHRIRMSGLPHVIHDWLAILLWDWDSSEMERQDFTSRWKERLASRSSPDAAWNSLLRLVGLSQSRISVSRLARRLASGSPPVELCAPDFGPAGPVVGTIHGAKGREASEVRVYLPPVQDNQADDDCAEEARIVFVAATRAKDRLVVGHGATAALARRLERSGRAYTPYPFSNGKRLARACTELGRAGDLDSEGLVGLKLFSSERDAEAAQARCQQLAGAITEAEAHVTGPAADYRYAVRVAGDAGNPICFLSRGLNYDLFDIAKELDKIVHLGRKKPPDYFKHLRIFGARTLALAPDDESRELLHRPWRDSGFILAPMLIGYSMAYFR
jgi:superfamily I DNA/RNA helicase